MYGRFALGLSALALLLGTVGSGSASAARTLTWGYGAGSEQLGIGNAGGSRPWPVPVCPLNGPSPCSGGPNLKAAQGISAGDGHDLANFKSGVEAWGANQYGQLGNGTVTNFLGSAFPVQVCAPSPGLCPGSQLINVKEVSAGNGFSLALLTNGTVVAWGQNNQGQLGNGTTTDSSVPVPVCAINNANNNPGPCPEGPYLEGVTSISAGDFHSMVRLSSLRAVAWGDLNPPGNTYSNELLGNGTSTGSTVPMTVCAVNAPSGCSSSGPYLEKVKSVSAGDYNSLAVLPKGRVAAWGRGSEGELGNGTTANSSVPLLVCAINNINGNPGPCPEGPYLEGIKTVGAGEFHDVALLLKTGNGRVVAWGDIVSGFYAKYNEMLGNHTTAGSTVPMTVCAVGAPVGCSSAGPYLEGVKAVAVGDTNSLAILPDLTVAAWGFGQDGELGNGTIASSSVPVRVCETEYTSPCPTGPYMKNAKKISTDLYSSLAVGGP
jgi:alpha-tubulin suppressor-like RCC1 family protein